MIQDPNITETTVIHENARYKVLLVNSNGCTSQDCRYDEASNPIVDYYAVYSKEYGVEELWTIQLPEAISAAESLDLALETQPWVTMRDLTLNHAAHRGGDPFGGLDFSFGGSDDDETH
jgi:hypothetical protein